jgi:hypothetical protein
VASITKYRGKWRCQVRRKDMAALSKTFERHADASAWGAEIETKIAAGVSVEPERHRDIETVADLLDWYLDTDEAKAKKSASNDHDRSKNIKRIIGNVDAFKLTSAGLSQYKRDRLAYAWIPRGLRPDSRQPGRGTHHWGNPGRTGACYPLGKSHRNSARGARLSLRSYL